MRRRLLGSTGFLVSEIGFGAWGVGGDKGGALAYGPTSDRESQKALLKAVDQGINFFDTSPLYGYGHSEELLGRTLKPFRKKVFFASKAGRLDFKGETDYSWASLQQSIEKSLKRLKTDYLDLFQLHDPPVSILKTSNIFSKLVKQREKGIIRAVGVSAKSPEEALQIATEYPVETIQVNFNLMDQRIRTNGLIPLCQKKRIGLIIRTPLCFGFLTGAYNATKDYAKTDHRSLWSLQQRSRWNEGTALFLKRLNRDNKYTPAQVALNFCLSFKEISTIIPGMLSTAQVVENCKASGMQRIGAPLLRTLLSDFRATSFFIR